MENSANDDPSTDCALDGKRMLSSGITLFIFVCVVVCFHTYARCCSTRAHHRRLRQQLNPPSAANNNNANISSSRDRLDPQILKTLPIFVYSSTPAATVLECAVCLSEFEDGERGRTLPKCGHAFHVACIDAWFRSHSNCPLCRAPVQPDNIVVVVDPPETSSAGVVTTVSNEPSGVSETRDSAGLSGSFQVVGFQPEWCPIKAEGLVGFGGDFGFGFGKEAVQVFVVESGFGA